MNPRFSIYNKSASSKLTKRKGYYTITLTECGSSSVVEHRLPKPGVEGSNPFSRSRVLRHFHNRGSALFCF